MKRNLAVSAGVLFVLLVTAGLLRQEPDRKLTPTSYGVAPFGYKALFDLLSESNLPVGRNLAAARALPERTTVWWIEPTSLCRSAADEPATTLDPWSGRGWIERGGTAVVFLASDSGPPVCDSVAGEKLPPRYEPPAEVMPTPTPGSFSLGGDEPSATPIVVQGPRLRAARHLRLPKLGLFKEGGDWTVGAAAGDRPFVLERPVGEGRLVVIGDAALLSNHWLGEDDAAPFVVDLVAAYGTPLIDEHDHGFGATRGTVAYLWHSAARPAFLGLALLGLTFAWWGAALSPRTAAGDERPAPTLESYVDSLATLYARAGDHAAVAARYRELALAQLRRASALPPDTPPDLLIERFQRQRLLHADEIHLLRQAPATATAAELQRYAGRLDEIVRKATSR